MPAKRKASTIRRASSTGTPTKKRSSAKRRCTNGSDPCAPGFVVSEKTGCCIVDRRASAAKKPTKAAAKKKAVVRSPSTSQGRITVLVEKQLPPRTKTGKLYTNKEVENVLKKAIIERSPGIDKEHMDTYTSVIGNTLARVTFVFDLKSTFDEFDKEEMSSIGWKLNDFFEQESGDKYRNHFKKISIENVRLFHQNKFEDIPIEDDDVWENSGSAAAW